MESSVADHRAAADRLLETIAAACDPAAEFPEQLRAALAVALALFAAEPGLAHLLLAEPFPGGDRAATPLRGWRGRCGGQLRRAARSCPRAGASPLFFEPLLIDSVSWSIADHLRSAGAAQLPDLLPDLLESMLAYYLDPAEVSAVVAGVREQAQQAAAGEERPMALAL